jgi:hypothetical protein
MKKILCLLFAIFTFTFGVRLSQTRALIVPVSLCEAKEAQKFLRGREIRVKGLLEVIKFDDGEYYATVSNVDRQCFGGAVILDTKELVKDGQIAKLFEELTASESEGGNFAAEVEVSISKIADVRESGMTSCFAPPHKLNVTSLKQTAPIRFFSYEESKLLYESSVNKLTGEFEE